MKRFILLFIVFVVCRTINAGDTIRIDRKIDPFNINELSHCAWVGSLTGSRTERKLMFGTTALTRSPYIIFENDADAWYLYYGDSEGGPAFDKFAGKIIGVRRSDDGYTVRYRQVLNLEDAKGTSLYANNKHIFEYADYAAVISFKIIDHNTMILTDEAKLGYSVIAKGTTFYKNIFNVNKFESRITENGVRIRSQPSLLESVLAVGSKDEKVHLLSKSIRTQTIQRWNDYWYEVETHKGVIGWVYGAFIDSSLKDSVPTNEQGMMVSESEK
ncbi:SH3 domain-containing protein [Treponema socranskii]|uniref:SH3 domain-containing protein n=1 Tax=Treponema socranskii TaxID=53419 RepID=UPI0023EF9220|nr:SH3 domain-containing protein [Treponema socranskii]